MGKRSRVYFFLLLLVSGMMMPFFSFAESDQSVHFIPVEQTVERGLESFLERAINNAIEEGADHVVLEMDTLGGAVNAAENIGEIIQTADVEITTYVTEHAISAGAYIALNADNIVMAPGAHIGAASVVDGSGNAAGYKQQSLWSSNMREAAESNGRDPQYAHAMVDGSYEVDDINQVDNEPLTLNTSEAYEVGYADGTASDRDELLAILDLSGAEQVDQEVSLAESLTRMLTNPFVIPILLSVGAIGLIVEFFTPGFGIAGLVGASSLGLFFFGHLFAGFAGWESLILLILGLILIVVEIVFTGFGLFGLLGVGSIIGSIFLASFDTSQIFMSILIAVIAAGVSAFIMFRYFGRFGLMKRFILADTLSSEERDHDKALKEDLIGKTGVTLTPLRPGGIGEISGNHIDVVSEGKFIEKGKTVKVVRTDGASIVVREQKEM